MELKCLYENLWKVGEALQGHQPESILEGNFRPWPKVRPEDELCVALYGRLETGMAARRGLLRNELTRRGGEEYGIVFKEVIALFGEGIHESLRRTLGDFLDATGGAKANSKLQD